MDPYQSRQSDHLGVNKMGRNIKKSPIHQPTFVTSTTKQQNPQVLPQPQPQPHVYNINKNDFRELVQQLTGSPLRDPPSRPMQSQPRPPNNRLLRVRPPPLAPTNRPQVPVHHYLVMAQPNPPLQPQIQRQPQPQPLMVPLPYQNSFVRPSQAQSDQPSPGLGLPPTPTDVWTNTAESPISVYMRYLQNSIMNSGPRQPQPQPQPNVQGQAPQNMAQHQPSLPNGPAMLQFPSTRPNAPVPLPPSPRFNALALAPRLNGPVTNSAPSTQLTAPPSVPAPSYIPALPSPGPNPPPFLPSPTSQFLISSPTGFWNVLSPRSQYPLLSPGCQFPPPLSPSFSFSSLGQPGILVAGPHTPTSPGYGFSALSPSGFFPISSPRWRNQ